MDKKKRRKKIKLSDILLHLFFVVVTIICIYPILLIVFNAFSSEAYIQANGYVALPKEFSTEAFAFLFQNSTELINATVVSCVSAIGGGLFSVIVSAMIGYSLTRLSVVPKRIITVILTITMFFNAGLIPTYMVNTTVYHLENSWILYIVNGSVTAFNVFVYRTFFNQIPFSLIESAEIDGASHMQIFGKIVLPLSMPIMATQLFLNICLRWKDYTTSLYYMTDQKMVTLEYYILQILKDANIMKDSLLAIGIPADSIPLETMRFATVLFTLVPMFIMFPFMQRYFKKGAVVGAVKG